jgi:hypothetical protein
MLCTHVRGRRHHLPPPGLQPPPAGTGRGWRPWQRAPYAQHGPQGCARAGLLHLPTAYLQAGTNTEKATIGQQPGDNGGKTFLMHGISNGQVGKYLSQRRVRGAHGLHGGLHKHTKTRTWVLDTGSLQAYMRPPLPACPTPGNTRHGWGAFPFSKPCMCPSILVDFSPTHLLWRRPAHCHPARERHAECPAARGPTPRWGCGLLLLRYLADERRNSA